MMLCMCRTTLTKWQVVQQHLVLFSFSRLVVAARVAGG